LPEANEDKEHKKYVLGKLFYLKKDRVKWDWKGQIASLWMKWVKVFFQLNILELVLWCLLLTN
jgi:hypothetical protein